MDRRVFLSSCAILTGGVAMSPATLVSALKTHKEPSRKARAYRAIKTLALGWKAPVADVQALIIEFVPSVVVFTSFETIRLVQRGGKKSLSKFDPRGQIDLDSLYAAGILTPEGVNAMQDKRFSALCSL